jgi:hypothetical protein
MPHGTILRTMKATLFAALLLIPTAALAQDRAAEDKGGAFASIWSFLAALLPGGEGLDNRCTIDPNGGVSCAATGASPDTRCTIDPDGRASCEPVF